MRPNLWQGTIQFAPKFRSASTKNKNETVKHRALRALRDLYGATMALKKITFSLWPTLFSFMPDYLLYERGRRVFTSFWQKPISYWTAETLQDFLDGTLEENEYLDYKQPSAKLNGQWQVSDKVLKSLCAMSNTYGGLVIIGVAEDSGHKPGRLVGIQSRDPVDALMTKCALEVDPPIRPDVQLVQLDEPPGTSHTILVARVHSGSNPPYMLREHGIFVRIGEQNRHATVAQVEFLFGRRVTHELVPNQSPWRQVVSQVIATGNQVYPHLPALALAACTPSFPADTVPMTAHTDEIFLDICRAVGVSGGGVRTDADNVYVIGKPGTEPEFQGTWARAFGDGSVGLTRRLDGNLASEDPRHINPAFLWMAWRDLMQRGSQWCRDVCGADFPLTFRLGVGNLRNAILAPDLHSPAFTYVPPPDDMRNERSLWERTGEWTNAGELDNVISESLGLLARVLQFHDFETVERTIRKQVGAS